MLRPNIPTALSPNEVEALRRICRDQRVVECGALLGFSTIVIADVAKYVISIDRHEGYGPPTYRPFMSNISRYRDRIFPIIGDVREALLGKIADRYFIDLDGKYRTTLSALCAIPAGPEKIVAVHDFGRAHCDGVEKAIITAGYDVLEVIDTLAVCRRR